jgi:hypothetical protein
VFVTQNEPADPGTTGDPQVDAALDKLADLAELPLNEHPAVFEQIHGALTGALGTLDSGTGGPNTGGPDTGGAGPGHPGSGS